MPSDFLFQKHLRIALNHLYNRDFLRKTPLLSDLGLSEFPDAPLVLQRIINEAIEALKPAGNEPMHTDKRRVYDILVYRYVEQFKQNEVAYHLGVSLRQFKREQDRAIETLVYYLWEKYGLGESQGFKNPEESLVRAGTNPSSDWDWLSDSRTEWVTDTRQLAEETLRLLRPLANQYGVQLECTLAEGLPELAVHPVAFRQILLNLVRKAIDWASGGLVTLHIETRESYTEFQIYARPSSIEPATARPTSKEEKSNLIMIAEELVKVSGGQLTIEEPAAGFRARLALPIIDGITVLVVDDNPDITELLKRYTTGTRYRVIGVTNPEQALHMAVEVGAKIIVLDVMMPKIDGWELLGRIRRHPQTAHIPVIIQTILTQKDLALSLGAKALIPKPVKQESFLAALEQVAGGIRSN